MVRTLRFQGALLGVALGLLAACSPDTPDNATPTSAAPATAATVVKPGPLTADSGYEARLANAKASPSATTRRVAEILERYGTAADKAAFASGVDYSMSPTLAARFQPAAADGAREAWTCHVPRCNIRPCPPKLDGAGNCGIVDCPDPICINHDPQPQVPCKGKGPC